MTAARLRVLSLSTMFPSVARPHHGVFVLNRLRALAGHVDLRVLSPVPVFPIVSRLVSRYRIRRSVPEEELHQPVGGGDPFSAYHPRFLSVPAIAKPLDGATLACVLAREIHRLAQRGFVPEVIDAHLAFPDGFAAVLVGRALRLPVTVTLRGHDINELQRFPVRWRQVRHTLRRADGIFGVSRALVDAAVAAGAAPERTAVLTNGVDPSLFTPQPRLAARAAIGLAHAGRLVLSVGHMVARKGFDVLVDALALLRRRGHADLHLAIVGGPDEEGDCRAALVEHIARAGLRDAVHLVGPVHHERLATHYAAADVFALASAKEGWPNVLFESLACGVPVVATRVWGVPECVRSPAYGILVDEQTGPAFADALERALAQRWDTAGMIAYARANPWEDVGRRVAVELRRAVGRHAGQSEVALVDALGPVASGANPRPGEVDPPAA